MTHQVHRVHRARTVERQTGREQLIQDDAQRVDIHGRGGFPARGLLGGHVFRSSDRRAGQGQRRAAGVDQLRHAEVRDLRLAVPIQQYVRRLQVSVNHAETMSGVRRPGQLLDHSDGELRCLRSVREPGQTPAVHEFQGDERTRTPLPGKRLDGADLENLDDVRVLQPGDGLGLGVKSIVSLGIRDGGAVEHLEGDGSLQVQMPGLVDDPHSAAADERENLVAANARQLRSRRSERRGKNRCRREEAGIENVLLRRSWKVRRRRGVPDGGQFGRVHSHLSRCGA